MVSPRYKSLHLQPASAFLRLSAWFPGRFASIIFKLDIAEKRTLDQIIVVHLAVLGQRYKLIANARQNIDPACRNPAIQSSVAASSIWPILGCRLRTVRQSYLHFAIIAPSGFSRLLLERKTEVAPRKQFAIRQHAEVL